MRRMFESLLGGAVVYVVMAACSGTEQAQRTDRPAGTGGAAIDDSGALSNGRDAVVNAIDALSDPVREAAAQSLPPQIDEVPCLPVPVGDSGAAYFYAEKTYQGASANELARTVVAVGALNPAVFTGASTAFSLQQTLAFVRDGAVSVFCGSTSGQSYLSVRFIRGS